MLNECQEVKVEAFSDEEEILRDDEIRLGFQYFCKSGLVKISLFLKSGLIEN